jgi:outer membrane protein OmpA-like peptidoglycan-associated protein
MKFLFTAILISVVFSNLIFPQKYSGRKFHPYSGTMVLTAEGGITLAYTDYKGSEHDYLGRASLEYYFPAYSAGSFGLKVFSGVGFIAEEDIQKVPDYFRTKLSFIGAGIVYTLSIGNSVFPYSFAGASYLWFDPRGRNNSSLINNSEGNYKKHEINFNGEIGLRILIAGNLTFNLSGGIQASPNDNLDDKALGEKTDLFFVGAAGFSFSFFGGEDTDKDGVDDDMDMCPDTPPGIPVDDFGCPFDFDNDGIPDFLDKCPGTPIGVNVDADGCPLDSDNDAIPDYLDKCPGTPKGILVNNSGCPVDSDKDGIPDYLDKCPNTPAGVVTNESGCPEDSDRDGIPDYMDRCPNTPPDVEVDEKGCSKILKKIIIQGDANFEFGKARLLSSAYPLLNNLAQIMKDHPETKWRIEGHTDSKGLESYNMELSRKRALSVVGYLVNLGVKSNQLDIVPMGESYPIAANDTEEGRAMNRRVEIKIIE